MTAFQSDIIQPPHIILIFDSVSRIPSPHYIYYASFKCCGGLLNRVLGDLRLIDKNVIIVNSYT